MKLFKLHSRTDEILKYVFGSRVLDVGCSGGEHFQQVPSELHVALSSKYPDVTGIDINRERIEIIQSKGYRNVYVGDAETFSFAEPFDTIIAGELIEHLTNPANFLTNCREHLAPQGVVVITTPYAFALLHILFSIVHYPKTCSHSEHSMWFCPSTISELTQRCGLTVRETHLIENYISHGPTLAYRFLVKVLCVFRPIIPKRLRCNSILIILENGSGK